MCRDLVHTREELAYGYSKGVLQASWPEERLAGLGTPEYAYVLACDASDGQDCPFSSAVPDLQCRSHTVDAVVALQG